MKYYLICLVFFSVAIACTSKKNVETDKGKLLDTFAALKKSDLPLGTRVSTKGFYAPGDGGGSTYIIQSRPAEMVDDIACIRLNNGNYAVFEGNSISTIQYGFKQDLKLKVQAFELNGNILSCKTCSFTKQDVGKAIYLEKAFYMGQKLERASQFKGTVASYSKLPRPGKSGIWKVRNASDDPIRKGLKGAHYYAAKGKKWIYLKSYSDMWFYITDYSSSQKVRINYYSPIALQQLTGKYGTNNWDRWSTHCKYKLNTGIKTLISEGALGLFQSDQEWTPYQFDDGKLRTLSQQFVEFKGLGSNISFIHYYYTPDTMRFESDPGKPDPAFLHGFYGIDQKLSKDELHHIFEDFSIIGNSDNSFRGVDGRNRRTFSFSNGKGSVQFRNMQISGGDGWFYTGGNWKVNASNCTYDGLQQSEACIQQFSNSSVSLERCTIKNVGPPNAYAALNNRERGRSFYVHPHNPFTARNCRFENINGRGQFYSGGGKDRPSDPKVEQRFESCDFIWDKPGITGFGIYTSRIQQPIIKDCRFISKSKGGMQRGILISSGATIENCYFENGYAISNGSNVGSNNVYGPSGVATTKVINCTFKNAQIDFTSLSSSNAPHEFQFQNCSFTYDANLKTTGQLLRIYGKNPKTDALNTITFDHCSFKGSLPGLGQRGVPILFCEPNGKANLFFKNTQFDIHSNSGTSGQVNLVKQLRGAVKLHLEACTIPSGDTLRVDLDPYTGEKGPKLFGSNNDIEHILYTSDSDIQQALEVKQKACPKVLSAGKTLKGLQYNFSEYTVKGSIPIQNLQLSGNRKSGQLLKGVIKIKASGNLTFQAGGNIDLPKPLKLRNGQTVQFSYNAKLKKYKVVP